MTWDGSRCGLRTSSAITCGCCAKPGWRESRRDGKIVFYSLTDTGRGLVDAHLAAVQALT